MKSREAVWGTWTCGALLLQKTLEACQYFFLNNFINFSLRILSIGLRGMQTTRRIAGRWLPSVSVEAAVPAADIVTQQATRLPLQDYPLSPKYFR